MKINDFACCTCWDLLQNWYKIDHKLKSELKFKFLLIWVPFWDRFWMVFVAGFGVDFEFLYQAASGLEKFGKNLVDVFPPGSGRAPAGKKSNFWVLWGVPSSLGGMNPLGEFGFALSWFLSHFFWIVSLIIFEHFWGSFVGRFLKVLII